MRAFFDRVDAADPLALGICIAALLLAVGILYAVRIGAETRRFRRELQRRRNAYQHRLRRVLPPTPLRRVAPWPSVKCQDAWGPSAEEGHGHADPKPIYGDEIAVNAERHRRSMNRRPT